jgi:hypothetical protein
MSQVVGVFGPGAMLDLPERSVVVGGLDRWDMRTPNAFRPIEEPRLAKLLHQRLGDCLTFGGQAAAATPGRVSFAGANLCPKPEQKVPL